LEETEELENFARLGGDFVDTKRQEIRLRITLDTKIVSPLDPDNEIEPGLSRDIKVTRLSCSTSEADFLLFTIDILLHICLGPLENDPSLGDVGLASNNQSPRRYGGIAVFDLAGSMNSCKFFLPRLFIVLSLFEECLWDINMLKWMEDISHRPTISTQ
jgi:hypothetical protein